MDGQGAIHPPPVSDDYGAHVEPSWGRGNVPSRRELCVSRVLSRTLLPTQRPVRTLWGLGSTVAERRPLYPRYLGRASSLLLVFTLPGAGRVGGRYGLRPLTSREQDRGRETAPVRVGTLPCSPAPITAIVPITAGTDVMGAEQAAFRPPPGS